MALFSVLVVCYLFLGGAGAGACLVLAVMGLLVPREVLPSPAYRALFGPAYAAVLVVLGLGMACLLADVGRVDRLVLLLVQPTTSFMAVGAYALFACFLLAMVVALAWSGPFGGSHVRLVRVLETLLAAMAVVVMLYTGLLLQSLRSVPLWNTPWLPVLFVLSSLSCGLALVVGVSQFTRAAHGFATALRRAMACDVAAIALECVAVAAFVAVSLALPSAQATEAMATPTPMPTPTDMAAIASANDLVSGSLAAWWWGGFVGLGLALPLAIELALLLRLARRRTLASGVVLFVSACVLLGGFVMRFCIVEAGMHPVAMMAGLG